MMMTTHKESESKWCSQKPTLSYRIGPEWPEQTMLFRENAFKLHNLLQDEMIASDIHTLENLSSSFKRFNLKLSFFSDIFSPVTVFIHGPLHCYYRLLLLVSPVQQ